jgi:hypothetical protein
LVEEVTMFGSIAWVLAWGLAGCTEQPMIMVPSGQARCPMVAESAAWDAVGPDGQVPRDLVSFLPLEATREGRWSDGAAVAVEVGATTGSGEPAWLEPERADCGEAGWSLPLELSLSTSDERLSVRASLDWAPPASDASPVLAGEWFLSPSEVPWASSPDPEATLRGVTVFVLLGPDEEPGGGARYEIVSDTTDTSVEALAF